MSLSRWLRDYLYISLGGSHEGRLATYRNLMITMLLGGLWHGAGWNFVLWGGYHGTLLAVERACGWREATLQTCARAAHPHSRSISCSSAGWFLFRIGTLAAAADYLEALANPWVRPRPTNGGSWHSWRSVTPCTLSIVCGSCGPASNVAPAALQGVAIGVLVS